MVARNALLLGSRTGPFAMGLEPGAARGSELSARAAAAECAGLGRPVERREGACLWLSLGGACSASGNSLLQISKSKTGGDPNG